MTLFEDLNLIALLFKYYGTDWAAMIFTFINLYLLGNKNPKGFIFGFLSNICWAVFGLLAGSVANILANIVFFGMNVRGLYNWYKIDQRLPTNEQEQ